MSLSLSAAVVAKRILAAISAGRVKAAISAGRVLASVTASRISASVTSARLQAAIVIGRFIERLNASDNAFLSDVLQFVFGKSFQEDVGVNEQRSVNVDKPTSDNPSVVDTSILSYTKYLDEDGQVADSQVILSGKNVSDSSFVVDSDPVFAFDKSLSDSVFATDDFDGDATIEDDQSMSYTKIRTDIASVSESFDRTVVFSREFSDSTDSTDDLNYDLTKVLSDAFSSSDSHTSYLGKILSDSGNFSDSSDFQFGKELSDSPLFSDSQEFNVGKSLADTPFASDTFTRTVSFSRDFADSIAVTDDFNGAAVDDDQNAQVFKNFTNIGSMTDSEVKSVGKNPSDSASFAESGEYEKQDYVDTMTYFAENYVGTTGSLF